MRPTTSAITVLTGAIILALGYWHADPFGWLQEWQTAYSGCFPVKTAQSFAAQACQRTLWLATTHQIAILLAGLLVLQAMSWQHRRSSKLN